MDNRALLDAMEGIDDALVRRAEADRTGTGLKRVKRAGVLRRAIPVLSVVLLLAAGIAAGVILAQKTKQHAQPKNSDNISSIGSNSTAEPGGTDELQPTAEPEEPLTPEEILQVLSNFLKDEGFDAELSYKSFQNDLARYSIGGISVMDFSDGNNTHYSYQYDDEDCYGWAMAFGDSFRAGVESSSPTNTCDEELYFVNLRAPVEGLELPFGIKFGDSVALVLEKLGIDADESGLAVVVDALPVSTTLARANTMLLYYTDCIHAITGDYVCSFSICFTEDFDNMAQYTESRNELILFFDGSSITNSRLFFVRLLRTDWVYPSPQP